MSACGRQEPVTIGSKEFSENRILAEMFAVLITDAGIPVKRIIPYGNTFDLQKPIKLFSFAIKTEAISLCLY
jgi:glycine betaine/choline ABC-type transport system substrate-binding protein